MLESLLINAIKKAINEKYQVSDLHIALEKTPKNFSGDYTFVVFPLLRYSRKKPEETAKELGEELKKTPSSIKLKPSKVF